MTSKRRRGPIERLREPGSFSSTALGTFLLLSGVPVGGAGVMALLFGGFVVGTSFTVLGVVMHFTGRRMVER